MADFYGQDLTYIHHTSFGDFSRMIAGETSDCSMPLICERA